MDIGFAFATRGMDSGFAFAERGIKLGYEFARHGMDLGYEFSRHGLDLGYEFASLGEAVGPMANRVLFMAVQIGVMADRIGEMADRILFVVDQVGEMADRILFMADKILEMADKVVELADKVGYESQLIVYTEQLIVDECVLITTVADAISDMVPGLSTIVPVRDREHGHEASCERKLELIYENMDHMVKYMREYALRVLEKESRDRERQLQVREQQLVMRDQQIRMRDQQIRMRSQQVALRESTMSANDCYCPWFYPTTAQAGESDEGADAVFVPEKLSEELIDERLRTRRLGLPPGHREAGTWLNSSALSTQRFLEQAMRIGYRFAESDGFEVAEEASEVGPEFAQDGARGVPLADGERIATRSRRRAERG